MRKINKFILMLVAIIFMMIINANPVDAKYFSYYDLCTNERLLCTQHHQTMYGSNYNLVATINITGNTSTGNDKTVESWHNAKLASILSHRRGQGALGNGDVEGLAVQNAIWHYMGTWIKNVGIQHGITNYRVNGPANYIPRIYYEAEEYANNYKKDTLKDKTEKDKIKVESYTEDGENYLRVGPFKYEFTGELSGIQMSTDKNNDVKINSIEKKIDANTFKKYSKVEDIKSNDEIYITIKTPTDGSERITGLKVKSKTNEKSVSINFWKESWGSQQNLLEYTYRTKPLELENSFDYDIKFYGNLKVIKVDAKNNEIKLANVGFKIKNKELEKYVKQTVSGDNKVITYVDEAEATEFITDQNGEISIDNLIVGTYIAYETKNPNYGYEILKDGQQKRVVVDKTEELKIKNTKIVGNLKVIKVDRDNNVIKLKGVKFIIQNKDTKKYVKTGKDEVLYVDNEKDAEVFVTDENGEFTVKDLLVGTYIVYEKENPNVHYEIIEEGKEKDVVIDKTAELKIENTQISVDLSGFVWIDRVSGKQSLRNDLYKDGEYDSNDILLDGIKVRLMRNGKVVVDEKGKEFITTTQQLNRYKNDSSNDGHGEYLFEKVPLYDQNDKERKNIILNEYYVEFEYDGLTYTNVIAHTDKDNGSKAAENSNVRTNFNNDFAVVEGNTSNTGITRDVQGNKKHDLTYNTGNHKAELDKTKSYYSITANTDETGYKIKEHYIPGQKEIKFINLGLYEREMPDIRLEKDVENVELSINGYHHVYEYGSKKLDNYSMEKDSNNFNVGVKFASTYTGTYKRAVYTPDYNYTLANKDKDSKLNVYITYRVAMYNEATTLKARVNSIVDYYDKNLTIQKIGTGINKETGEITGDLAVPQTEQSGDYNKVVIQNNTEIEPEKTSSIYVRFKLSDQEILNAFNDRNGKMTYKNIAEVNSYSVFDEKGNVYAGIDKDSAPANATPGDVNTYEDDTNQAPGIQLEVTGDRTLSGSVFLDESTGEVAQVRLGDGIYDTSKEHGIAGVNVKLTEVDENGNVKEEGQPYTTTTDENGNFTISNFIPGNYTLTYTWGDTTYTVKDFKGTIWTESNRNEKQQNGNNWYKVNMETRYSDAMDNWETRQKIDAGENITTMDSTTPTMTLSLEVNSVYSIVPDVDRFVAEGYEIKNVDFGIVERARQQIDIDKKIKTFKVTLANGQVVVDAQIDENGNLTGTTNNLIYMKPGTTSPAKGQLWLQLDSELIQGAKAQIGYEIKVSNNSELDYDTENYYKYGTDRNNIITITPAGVYDYLDGTVIDSEKDKGQWEVISKEEYNAKYPGETITEKYFLNEMNSSIDENGNIVKVSRWEVASQTYQEIYTEWAYETTESRTVRDVKLNNKTILHNAELEKELEPGKSNAVALNTSVMLANSNEIDLNNDAEITEVRKNKNTGRDITPALSKLVASAPEVTITPPTGENNNYILIIGTVVSALIILGAGVVLIKRKTL